MAWFPIFEKFIDGPGKRLTPTEKLYFWYIASRFNKEGEFYQSDLEIAVTMATSEKTVRRARAKLVEMGMIQVKPGQLKSNRPFATRYLLVRYANTTEELGFYAQIQRYTFETMFDFLRKGRLQHGDVVVYICLYYWCWRTRGKYEDRDRFFITKKELQNITCLRDAATRVLKVYDAFIFSEGSHLFEYKEEHHRFIFKDWSICADPDKDEKSRQNAERRLEEIKNSVKNEKRDRQRKLSRKRLQHMKNA